MRLPLVVAVVACVFLSAGCTTGPGSSSGAESTADRATVVKLSAAATPADPAVEQPTLLAEVSADTRYRDCLLSSGFDPEGVQVLYDDAGEPWWVKTGHDVPPALHGPCFTAIGGEASGMSSWGNMPRGASLAASND